MKDSSEGLSWLGRFLLPDVTAIESFGFLLILCLGPGMRRAGGNK